MLFWFVVEPPIQKYSPHINQSSQVWLKNNKYLKHFEILKPPTSTERLRDTSNIFSLGGSLRLQQCFAPAGPRARNVNTSLAQKKPADFVSVQCNHYTPRKQRQLIHTSSLWSRVCLKIWYPPKKNKLSSQNLSFLGCTVYGIPCFQTNPMSITGSKTQLLPPGWLLPKTTASHRIAAVCRPNSTRVTHQQH